MNARTQRFACVLFAFSLILLALLAGTLAKSNSLTLEAEQHWETYGVGGTCIPGGHNLFLADVDDDDVVEIITGGFTYDLENGIWTNTAAPIKIWSWNGQNMTLEESHKWSGASIGCVYAGDADGDEKTEIITGGRVRNGTSIYVQLRIWQWNGSSLVLKTNHEWTGGSITSIFISDVDKDGKPEILTSGRFYNQTESGAQLRIWQWDGNALALKKIESWCAGEQASANSVSAYDLNNDGVVEVVTCGYDNDPNNSSGQLRIWHWNGEELSLKANSEWRLKEGVCGLSISGSVMGNTMSAALEVGDVDGDGTPEIVTGGFAYDGEKVNGQLRIWSWNEQDLVLEGSREWGNADVTEIESLSINDVDGDGKQEIVTSGTTGNATTWPEPSHCLGQIKVWRWEENSLSLENSQEWMAGEATSARNVASGDIDEDGIVEIVTVGCIYVSSLCDPDMRIWSIADSPSPVPTTSPSAWALYIGAGAAITIIIAAATIAYKKKPKRP